MLRAGEEALECLRVLEKVDLNLVGEVLGGHETFYELEHYPTDDVFDVDSHSQYYYHAHRGIGGEHGHFHLFLRGPGMPAGARPVGHRGDETWPQSEDAIAHLIAISMDAYGRPIGLFTTNRWVTAETWHRAPDVIGMLERFRIDHAHPSWPVNRWITAMVRLFRPHIESLLLERDEAIARWAREHPDRDAFEDRELEITSECAIDVEAQVSGLRAALAT